jgi:hypothetical protein
LKNQSKKIDPKWLMVRCLTRIGERMIGTWIGVIIGVISIAFALYERSQRIRVESVVKDTLRRLAGEMRVIYSNANWTNLHLRNVGHSFAGDNPDLNRIKMETFDAARDAASCARQLSLAHSKIRGIQQSLFHDSVESLPEIPSDDVGAAEFMLQAQNKKSETNTESTSLKVP